MITVIVYAAIDPYWSIVPGVFMGFLAFFFRNPKRKIPSDNSLIVSPADGKVMSICEVYDEHFLNEVGIKVTIFLSVFERYNFFIAPLYPFTGLDSYYKSNS